MRLPPGGAGLRQRGGGALTSGRTREVVVFHAQDCSLCERARAQLERLQGELGFDLQEIDITGDPELEAAYREWLPVVEIGGERAFVYYLDEDAFRRKLSPGR